MKIIIAGCGKVGQKIAQMLSIENNDVTVVDIKSQAVSETTELSDVAGIVGSGAVKETLIEAGIKDAEIFVAVTGSDELNILCCLMAAKTGNCQTIARVRNPEYSHEMADLKDDLGLALVINPEQAAAYEAARILKLPQAIKIDTFAKGRVEIMKFKVPEGSVLNDMAVYEISNKLKCDVLLCAVEREDNVYIPRGDFIIKEKDVVSVIASTKNAVKFFSGVGILANRVKNAIIVGGGMIGFYLADILLQTGIAVKIIDKNFETCERLSELLPKAEIINGDATEQGVLTEAGIEYADSVICVTNVDEENILLSLYAKTKSGGKAKVITKVNKIPFDEVINNLELDTIIRPKSITAEYIVRFVRAKKNSIGSNVETMHSIIEGKAEALEFIVKSNSDIVGIPLEKLDIKENILIACINRKGTIITPRGGDTIEVGDTVVVVTTEAGLDDITDILNQ